MWATLFFWLVVFLAVAVIAAILGFWLLAVVSATIAKWIFAVFLILLVISVIRYIF